MLAVDDRAKDSSGNSGGEEDGFKGWVWNFKSLSLSEDMLWLNPVLWFDSRLQNCFSSYDASSGLTI